MATFIVENGTGLADSNSYASVAEADEYLSNFGAPATWTAASQAAKETALRVATRYMDVNYTWKERRVKDSQALGWPRFDITDKDGFTLASNIVPPKVKACCIYLATRSVAGDDLLGVQENEGTIKSKKDVIGPITEEVEYVGGEEPESLYPLADGLVEDLVSGDSKSAVVDLHRC